jgi:hypothetical protein
MSDEKPKDPEEQIMTWLAACDDALAAGTPPPPPLGRRLETTPQQETTPQLDGNAKRAREDLACAQLLREVLRGCRPELHYLLLRLHRHDFRPWRPAGQFISIAVRPADALPNQTR